MSEFNYFRFFKIWAISLSVYVVSMFLYLIISGRIIGEMYGGEIVLNISLLVMLLSAVEGIGSLIYSIVQKNKNHIFISIGVLALCFVLFLFSVVLAIAQVW